MYAQHGAEAWKAPVEPKTEAEKAKIDQSVAEHEQYIKQIQEEIDSKAPSDPSVKEDQEKLDKNKINLMLNEQY